MLLIGNLPTREQKPDTPILNAWYSDFPIISCEATDTDDDRAAKIEAAKAEGKFVIAFGKDRATDGKMLEAASLAFVTEDGVPGYRQVSKEEMVEIILWLADCATAYDRTYDRT